MGYREVSCAWGSSIGSIQLSGHSGKKFRCKPSDENIKERLMREDKAILMSCCSD